MSDERPEQRARAEAEQRYAELRQQGHDGWIGGDGRPVDAERWLAANRPNVAAIPTSTPAADQRAELVERMMAADPGADRPALAEHVDDMPSTQVAERLATYAAPSLTPSCTAELDATVAPAVEAERVQLGPFGMARVLDPAEVDPRDRAILEGEPELAATTSLAGRAEALAELVAAGADPAQIAEAARAMVDVAAGMSAEVDHVVARADTAIGEVPDPALTWRDPSAVLGAEVPTPDYDLANGRLVTPVDGPDPRVMRGNAVRAAEQHYRAAYGPGVELPEHAPRPSAPAPRVAATKTVGRTLSPNRGPRGRR